MNKKVIHILLADVTAIRVCLGIAAGLLAFGLLFATINGGGYELMLDHARKEVWALAFAVYAFAKFTIVFKTHVWRPLLYIIVLLGSYLWLFLFLSFTNSPTTDTSPADLMVLLLVFAEVWVGASTLSLEHKNDQ